jgi:hypothetical protein
MPRPPVIGPVAGGPPGPRLVPHALPRSSLGRVRIGLPAGGIIPRMAAPVGSARAA